MSDAEQAVRAALAAAGISPRPDEVQALVERYPEFRALMARMDEVVGADEAFPELVFDPRTP